MKNNNKFLWAIVCLLILIAFGGYLYTSDPFGWRGSEMQQSAEADGKETETADSGDNAKGTTTAGDKASDSTAESEKTTETAEKQDVSGDETGADANSASPIPTFDLVRVEPDGSTLIAGQATPGTEVEVVSNGQVIATTTAGATGDFAAVLDNPLPAGDHQIVLRTNGEGNTTLQSEEVATISVPESDPNELLVMVTKPGEASRILTKPDVAMVEAPQKPEASATESVAANKEQENQVSEEAFSESGETKVAAADSTATDETAQSGTSTQMSTQSASTTSSDKSTDRQSASTADTDANETTKTAAASETANVQSTSDGNSTATSSDLRIDAVEIEDGSIYVAGSATPGGQVRVYVDGEYIGSSGVSASGRFLVEAQRDLAVGDHTIGAELIMSSGESPVMRVAVPFARPEGQMVAAVAAPETSEDGQVQQSGETTTQQGTQVAAASQNDSSGSDSGVPQITEETTLPAQNDSNEQASAEGTQTPIVVQPALQQQDNSVIIRRGDTLWQISRRIYGQGVRYTTIYLANDHLMDHPDWIEPGQIFAVPETHVENAEQLHREHVRNRRN